MKKTHNLLLIITSLLGYLQWSNQSAFIFEAEKDVLIKLFTQPQSVLHPLVLLPLVGQCLLIITLFQPKPNKYLTIVGMITLELLLGIILLVGILTLNIRQIASTIPFHIVLVWSYVNYFTQKQS